MCLCTASKNTSCQLPGLSVSFHMTSASTQLWTEPFFCCASSRQQKCLTTHSQEPINIAIACGGRYSGWGQAGQAHVAPTLIQNFVCFPQPFFPPFPPHPFIYFFFFCNMPQELAFNQCSRLCAGGSRRCKHLGT